MKSCTKCKKMVGLDCFNKNRLMSDGLADWCKPCVKEYAASYYRKNSKKMLLGARRYSMRRNFNITIEQYESMYRKQNGACAICEKQNLSGKRLAVDHDHKTGKVRGLLCHRCNYGIGYLKDNLNLLRRAFEYVEGVIAVH